MATIKTKTPASVGNGTEGFFVKILVRIFPLRLSKGRRNRFKALRRSTTSTPDLNREEKSLVRQGKNIFQSIILPN